MEEGYKPNPYHNATHAADVLQSTVGPLPRGVGRMVGARRVGAVGGPVIQEGGQQAERDRMPTTPSQSPALSTSPTSVPSPPPPPSPHAQHMVVTRGGITPHYLGPLGHMGMYLSAVVHDYEHVGRTNEWVGGSTGPGESSEQGEAWKGTSSGGRRNCAPGPLEAS